MKRWKLHGDKEVNLPRTYNNYFTKNTRGKCVGPYEKCINALL